MARRKRASDLFKSTEVPEDWEPRIASKADLEELLSRLPLEPGVYVMRDRKGRVVYVGKARKLRNRVRQYFSGHDTRYFVPLLGKILGDIETIVVSNDKEALLLENNLIKEHRPRFNFKLRDDKQYLVIRLDPQAEWPRMELVRNIEQDGARYYGPYHSASRARHALRVVNRQFQLRTCSDFVLRTRKRPCLQYQIGRCPAPCVHDVDRGAYDQQVEDVQMFLGGKQQELVRRLTQRMTTAAEALEFETAARVRDQIKSLETSLQRQQVVGTSNVDQDVIGLYREGGQVEMVIMHVRGGQVVGTESFSEKGMELPDEELLNSFLNAYFDAAPFVPDEVLLPGRLADDDLEPLTADLRERKGRKVAVLSPERGEKKKLVGLANRNAASNFVTRRDSRQDAETTLKRIKDKLRLSRLPRRIECYDVSHIQGTDPVASMVTFVDGEPAKKLYRSFKIKGIDGLSQGTRQNDDFAAMYEVLGRRIRRGLQGDDEAWALPDLMVIDGGKGQLGQVVAALEDMGVPLGAEGVDLVSLAKERKRALGHGKKALEKLRSFKADKGSTTGAAADRPGQTLQDYVADEVATEERRESGETGVEWLVRPERVFIPGSKDALKLPDGSSELYLMTRVRDEAHRFAITHHRKRRGKRAIKSALDEIPGVGPSLKRALVKHFGSVKAIRAADESALAEVKGVGPALAKRIRETVGT